MKDQVLTNQKLLAALGLDGLSVVRLTIKAESGSLPVVIVEMHPSNAAADLLQEFELIPKASITVGEVLQGAIEKAKGAQD